MNTLSVHESQRNRFRRIILCEVIGELCKKAVVILDKRDIDAQTGTDDENRISHIVTVITLAELNYIFEGIDFSQQPKRKRYSKGSE